MPFDTTRLSVEIPKKTHKKLKILAEANGLTLKEFILAVIEPIIYPSHKPNKTTLKAMEEADSGIGLTYHKNLDEMWETLGLDE